jgi:hypothetical protein
MTHILAEIEKRIAQAKELLKLEFDHLRRVQERQLDDSFAQFVVESRQREIEHLEAQRVNRIKLIGANDSVMGVEPSTVADTPLTAD